MASSRLETPVSESLPSSMPEGTTAAALALTSLQAAALAALPGMTPEPAAAATESKSIFQTPASDLSPIDTDQAAEADSLLGGDTIAELGTSPHAQQVAVPVSAENIAAPEPEVQLAPGRPQAYTAAQITESDVAPDSTPQMSTQFSSQLDVMAMTAKEPAASKVEDNSLRSSGDATTPKWHM